VATALIEEAMPWGARHTSEESDCQAVLWHAVKPVRALPEIIWRASSPDPIMMSDDPPLAMELANLVCPAVEALTVALLMLSETASCPTRIKM
jgi:hypothetical protein